jgi:hypothetical protein
LALLDFPLFHGFSDEVYFRCRGSLGQFLSTSNAIDNEGKRQALSEIVSQDLREKLLKQYVRDTIEYFIYRLDYKLNTALNELWHEAYFLAGNRMTTETMRAMREAEIEVIHDLNEPTEAMNRLLTKFAAQRRKLLKSDLADCLWTLDFTELAEHYDRLLLVWKDAKTFYKQNSKRVEWRELIRVAHRDTEFDDDLLSRLTGNLRDLPEELRAKLREKGGITKKDGGSSPSSIALEHAARLCGAEPYQYSLRHLYNLKNEAKHRAETNGEETND